MPAPERNGANIVERGAVSARHDTHDARIGGQRPLALGREETFGEEPLLERFERLEQGSLTRGASEVPDELESASGRPNRCAPPDLQPGALDQVLARALRVEAVHDAIDDRVLPLVLEAEVGVAARRLLERGDLSFDPEGTRRRLDCSTQPAIELCHGNDFGPAHGARE